MKTSLTVAEFKARFAEVLETVRQGGTVSVTYGRSRKPVAILSPPPSSGKPRKLGSLAGKVKVQIREGWEIDDEAFLNPNV